MAKDDYFVIAYKILKLLYKYFKTGEKAEYEAISPEALGINNGYWVNIMRSLYDEGYIKGISFPSALGDFGGAKITDLKITQKGIEFLKDNSNIKKAEEFLRDIGNFVPGV